MLLSPPSSPFPSLLLAHSFSMMPFAPASCCVCVQELPGKCLDRLVDSDELSSEGSERAGAGRIEGRLLRGCVCRSAPPPQPLAACCHFGSSAACFGLHCICILTDCLRVCTQKNRQSFFPQNGQRAGLLGDLHAKLVRQTFAVATHVLPHMCCCLIATTPAACLHQRCLRLRV